MGAPPFFAFLILLMSVASARNAFMPIANDAERYHLLTDDNIDLQDLIKVFENVVSFIEDSPAEFSRSCLEISSKAKEVLNDQSLINQIDSLATTFCHTVPSELQTKLRSNETCMTCHSIWDTISNQLGDPNRELKMVAYLLKACESQPIVDKCKKFVFAFAPVALSGLQQIASRDVCHMLHICVDPRKQTQYVNLMHIGKSKSHLESKLANHNLM